MSVPLLGLVAGVPLAAAAPQAAGRRGGTLRVGSPATDGSLEPPLLQSLGALAVSHMAGEQLVFADKNSRLVPRIATSWKSSNKAKTWTFQIRRNVKFHDGTPLTAADVVATFKRLLTKDSQAQSSYKGVISRVRQDRVAHGACSTSPRRTGSSRTRLSQQTYQAIILPKTYKIPADLTKPGDWTSKMNGTGPWRLKENRGAAGYSFEANPTYWGGRPAIDAVEWQILEDQARATALQSGQIDLAVQLTYQGAQQVGDKAIALRTPTHRYLHMNTKKAPFNDVRVRQAFALALNRPQIAQGLWGKFAEVGERQPALARLRVHRQVRAAAQAGPREGAGPAEGRRRGEPQVDALAATGRSRCPTTRSASRRRSSRSASTRRSRCTRARSTSTASASAPAASSPRGSASTSGSSTTAPGRLRSRT